MTPTRWLRKTKNKFMFTSFIYLFIFFATWMVATACSVNPITHFYNSFSPCMRTLFKNVSRVNLYTQLRGWRKNGCGTRIITHKKRRMLKRMNDFTPLRYRYCGTPARWWNTCLCPFADRKLSWTAAIVPRHAWLWAGAGQAGRCTLRGLLDKLWSCGTTPESKLHFPRR